jgi:DNA-binding transcriptional MerR regulator
MTMSEVRPDGMSVSQLARRVGIRADTIRYYERVGLLAQPRRTAADHRRYDESVVDRLLFIQGAQRLGLRLREVQELLSVRDSGVCPCGPAEVLLRHRVAEIDDEITRLSRLRRELVVMADQLPGDPCPDPEPGTWRPPDQMLTRKEV